MDQKINREKTKLLICEQNCDVGITLGNGHLEVEKLCYLGSIVESHGGSEKDIKRRTGQAQKEFNMYKNI